MSEIYSAYSFNNSVLTIEPNNSNTIKLYITAWASLASYYNRQVGNYTILAARTGSRPLRCS